jgi:hypothetical protein
MGSNHWASPPFRAMNSETATMFKAIKVMDNHVHTDVQFMAFLKIENIASKI